MQSMGLGRHGHDLVIEQHKKGEYFLITDLIPDKKIKMGVLTTFTQRAGQAPSMAGGTASSPQWICSCVASGPRYQAMPFIYLAKGNFRNPSVK